MACPRPTRTLRSYTKASCRTAQPPYTWLQVAELGFDNFMMRMRTRTRSGRSPQRPELYAPGLKIVRLGVWHDRHHRRAESQPITSRKLAVKIEVVEARSATDVESALAQIKALHPDAVVIAPDTQLLSKRKEIADFMAEQRIPAIYPFREYASVGGLFIYGANLSVLFERAAEYLDKLLRGEKVSNLPVQQATAFELIVNSRTALALGLTVPPNILLRADDVIE